MTLRRWQVGIAFAIITLVFVLSLLWVQAGRLSSCRRTYEGVRQVFQPFLTPPPAKGKPKRDYETFNRRVDALKAQCSRQIKLYWP